MAELEGRGIPIVGIATTEFVQAAEAQANALGTEPAYIFVPHPIQDRTDEELRALADEYLDEIVTALTANGE